MACRQELVWAVVKHAKNRRWERSEAVNALAFCSLPRIWSRHRVEDRAVGSKKKKHVNGDHRSSKSIS
ncbi:hypothetical protein CONPUDRAFT_80062 [Coniophora puteana RWD-64-598 SS2]|uniref:Uncharacterized protein n=1 Tax=Coniophora puteana (strain RWD-64-598) TaxID=741705 RepID=A0A5M3N272_CONPW|nr:uncharacterized protein CONPUDRAFT_80062 [Coniophora puteana RWD-64-598 SS2]EIW85482.1 hypothetical protein CONPUDRAFT_80062 [Coniophora puteana RWD-64-598 SS2]